MDQTEMLGLLCQALEEEYGLEVTVSDPEVFKRRFYQARRTDESLKVLSLRACPTDPNNKLWIVNNGQEEA